MITTGMALKIQIFNSWKWSRGNESSKSI